MTPLLGREYIDAADTKTWGIAARTFTSDQIMDADTLKRVAERYLERHSQPTATVQLQGIDLSRITGEALDTFRWGSVFGWRCQRKIRCWWSALSPCTFRTCSGSPVG